MASTDAKATLPISWTNQLPQYMHNFQGPAFQHMPPYPGYHFPGLQTPGYYAGHMPWPPNVENVGELDRDRNHKSSSRTKAKSSHDKASRTLELEGNSDNSDSSSENVSDEYEEHEKRYSSNNKIRVKKHGNKSSRKVVIRNINYITSKRDGERGNSSSSSDEGEFINGDSLKQQVEEAVGSLERRHKSSSHGTKKREGSKHDNWDIANVITKNSEGEKSNENWDIFQNLILKDADSGSNVMNSESVQAEYLTTKRHGEEMPFAFGMESREMLERRGVSNDSFIVTDKYISEGKTRVENFETGENVCQVIKRDSTYEELLVSQRIEGSENYSSVAFSDCAIESAIIKNQQGDWFVNNQLDKSSNQDKRVGHNIFDRGYDASFGRDHTESGKNKKDVFVDDSFMVHSMDNSTDPQPRTDMFLVSDIGRTIKVDDSAPIHLQEKVEAASISEPDDLYMVLGRETASEQAVAPWNPEMDYGNSNPLIEAVKKNPNGELNESLDGKLPSHGKESTRRTNGAPERKLPSKEARPKASVGSLGRSRSEIISRSKKPPGSRTIVQKSKFEQVPNTRIISAWTLHVNQNHFISCP